VHKVPERNVVRDAIRHFIAFQLSENTGLRRQYEEARARRLKEERPEIHAVPNEED
jgi:hypothetical protein